MASRHIRHVTDRPFSVGAGGIILEGNGRISDHRQHLTGLHQRAAGVAEQLGITIGGQLEVCLSATPQDIRRGQDISDAAVQRGLAALLSRTLTTPDRVAM
jgi:hypothetical protein